MKTKEIFSLAIRLLGLVFLYHALRTVPTAGGLFISAFPHEVGPHVHEDMNVGRLYSALFMIGWPLFLAQWLIRGAPLIMRMAYDEPAHQENVESTAPAKADV